MDVRAVPLHAAPPTRVASSSDWTAAEEAIRRVSPERQRDAWQEIARTLSMMVSRTDLQALWRRLTLQLLRFDDVKFVRADEILLEVLGQRTTKLSRFLDKAGRTAFR
jgi:hypothetical protein